MGGGGDDVEAGVERIAHGPGRDQPADVRDVGHGQRADLVGHRLERRVVVVARIGGVAAEHHLRPRLLGRLHQCVEVDRPALVRMGLVADEVEHLAHVRDRRAVGQVAAVAQVHRQHGVAGLQEGEIDRLVHRRAGQRLHVGVLAAEQLGRPLPRGALDLVGELLAAVVAPAGIALGVLVGQHRAEAGQHLGIGVVLRGDHLDAVDLAALLAGDGALDLRVVGGKGLAVRIHGRSYLKDRPVPPSESPGAQANGASAPRSPMVHPIQARQSRRAGRDYQGGGGPARRHPGANGPAVTSMRGSRFL